MKYPSTIVQGVGERLRESRFLVAGAVASIALAGIGINSAAAVDRTEPPSPTDGWELTKAWDFNNGTLPDNWSVRVMEPTGDSQEYSTRDNVWVYGDSLFESVRRHCIKKSGDPVTKENQTTNVCLAGKKTVYSSGRIETPPFLTGNYKVEVKLRLAEMALEGMRTAVWVKNPLQYCAEPNTPNSEYDILEWYSTQPEVSTSTSYAFCEHGELNSSFHKKEFVVGWKNAWHTVSIEVEDHQITYFVDGEAVKIVNKEAYTDGKYSFPDITNQQYFDTFSEPMAIILNTEGFNDPDAKHEAFRAPDATKPFPIQKTEIESVRVYTKD